MESTGGSIRRGMVVLAAFALVAASCGQYENVHRGGVAAQGATSGGLGSSAGTSGAAPTEGLGTTSSGSTSSGIPTLGTTSSGPTGSSGSSGGSSAAAAPPPSGPGDTTGITPTTITVGLHAPVTGAAPVPVNSFALGANLYWKYGNNGKPVVINGRTVKTVFEDDHYDPSYAKQQCQKMAEDEDAFLLLGVAGTDQIQACAQYANSKGIPYLSTGATEIGLSSLPNYFALSMTYPDQSVLLVDYIKHVLNVTSGKDVAMVAEDTPNFDDAVAAFQKAFPGVTVYRPGKNDNGSSMAANLCTGTIPNFKVVYPLVAPVYYLEMAKAANCNPQYAGVGPTSGIDTVGDAGCKANHSTANAQFFSPWPAWQGHERFDKGYDAAVAAARKDDSNFPDDDIVWLLYGVMKSVGALLDNAGPNPTRGEFIYSTEHATGIKTGVYPDLNFAPDDHFGADQVQVLENVCKARGSQDGYYVTKYAFRSSF